MTAPPNSFQYDETLLYLGKYGEWFWSALSEKARNFLTRPQCPQCHRTPYQSNRPCECASTPIQSTNWVDREGPAWRLQAECRGVDLDVFFEGNAATFDKPDATWRKYCGCCKVSGSCTLYAVDSRSIGIFGGQLFDRGNNFKSRNPEGTGQRGRPRKKAEP